MIAKELINVSEYMALLGLAMNQPPSGIAFVTFGHRVQLNGPLQTQSTLSGSPGVLNLLLGSCGANAAQADGFGLDPFCLLADGTPCAGCLGRCGLSHRRLVPAAAEYWPRPIKGTGTYMGGA